ncbi:marine proteobacterial sortase target protein [Pseudohalioglobus lutimaris]|nr:marine proteobacterial sortase target protein [Pseudohalioglobus lutimaris]
MNLPRLYRTVSRDRQRFECLSWWLCFRCLPVLLMILLSLLLLSATAVRAESVAAGDVGSGQLLLTDQQGKVHTAMTQRSRVDMRISGMVAVVRLEQVFRNETEDWMEGVYAFPLPGSSAVRFMQMKLGERRIVGKIKEKEEARKSYQKALHAGKKASLVEQQRPNLFTTRVANVAPGEEVVVELEYVQTALYQDGRFSVRLPTTITPRYMPGIPGDELRSLTVLPTHGWAVPTDQVADAPAISPLQHADPGSDVQPHNPLEIYIELDAGMPLASVDSPYHQVILNRSGQLYTLQLAAGKTEMDRDFVLNWRPVAASAPAGALFTEQVDGEFYGLLMLVPPALQQPASLPPRELIFVIDTSGSMGGVSIRQARASLGRSLQLLRQQDRFNIIEFNSDYRMLFRRAQPATSHNLQLAGEFTRHLHASGGTEMLPVLRAALSAQDDVDELVTQPPLRQVVFITDGAVGNEEALFGEIVERIGASRLFTVGIGSAPNSWFMRKAADYGRGSYTSIGEETEVDATMSNLFKRLSTPAALDIDVTWPDTAEVWPQRVPDLYAGEPLHLLVKLGSELPDQPLIVSGRVGDSDWQTSLQWPAQQSEAAPRHAGVASLWARKKIEQLLGEKHRAEDPQSLRDKVLPIALRHQLLSPYTSYVAVEEAKARPSDAALESRPVPNSRPRGQSSQPYAYPRTATTATANIWLGSLLLLIAIFVRLCRQEGEHA